MRTYKLYLALTLLASSYAVADFVGPMPQVRVAVIDTGIDPTDPRFADHMCRVPHWDYVKKAPLTRDSGYHGTHIAGIIVALAGNSQGYCVMSCRYFDEKASGKVSIRRGTQCLKWAKRHGADFVNYSGGGAVFDEYELLALQAFPQSTTIVAAAGNEHVDMNLPDNEYYPASYPLPNIRVVGAVDKYGIRLASSNFGKRVNVVRPGENIYSTLPDGRFGYMSGTSMATAVETGLLVRQRILGFVQTATPGQIWEFLWNFWQRH